MARLFDDVATYTQEVIIPIKPKCSRMKRANILLQSRCFAHYLSRRYPEYEPNRKRTMHKVERATGNYWSKSRAAQAKRIEKQPLKC